ncbi:MAG TPA: metallophosphoesterase, partial [Myxococcota bacterium]|nr:metallophosphoesterase [Myxococcota bacterium]
FDKLSPHPDDWLILCGDVCESVQHLEHAARVATARFARVLWVPGNHELWTLPPETERGEARYLACVRRCQALGVLTPEDPFPRWEGEGGSCILAPLFLLYDYTFRPPSVTREGALAWARESGIECVDEDLLHPDPYPSRDAWCAARCELSGRRLEEASREGLPLVLINHWPLRQDLVRIPRVPRFSIWCGTTRTEGWHLRYRASVVISGHLHVRATDWRDGVRFEEVSIGYPRQWQPERGIDSYLRLVLPGPPPPPGGEAPTVWRR